MKNSNLFGMTVERSDLHKGEDKIYDLLKVNSTFFEENLLGFFDTKESLDSALKVIILDPHVIMKALTQVVLERENRIEKLPTPIQVAISSTFEKKAPNAKVRTCRLEFLLSYAYGVLCAVCLGRGNGTLTSAAMDFLCRVEYNLGCAMAHGESLPWSGPHEKFGAFDSVAMLGAYAKLAMDPKQKDKLQVRDCWDEWKKQPDRYKGKAAFARDMLGKYESLKSQPVVERWCREWESAAVTQLAQ